MGSPNDALEVIMDLRKHARNAPEIVTDRHARAYGTSALRRRHGRPERPARTGFASIAVNRRFLRPAPAAAHEAAPALRLSFGEAAALPAIVRGLATRGIIGADLWEWAMVKGGRDAHPGQKRQAIRARRPGDAWTQAGPDTPLELWWKTPGPTGRFLGRVACRDAGPLTIRHEAEDGALRVTIGDGVEVDPAEVAALDGLASVEAFRDAYAPESGTFRGWLIRW